MAKRLRVRKIKAVGFVDEGANQLADIMIWKRAGDAQEENGEVKEGNEGNPAPSLVQRVRTALGLVETELEKAEQSASNSDPTGEPNMAEQKDQHAELPEEVQEQITELGKRAADAEEALAAAQERITALEAPANPDEDGAADDVLKNLPEDVRKRFEDLETRAAEAEEIAKAEREARVSAEFAKQAEEDFSHLNGGVDEKVALLRALSNVEEEARGKIVSMLKAVDEQAKDADIFKESGKDGGSDLGDGPWSKIVAKASQMVKDGQAPTQEQAITKVLATDQTLAAEYTAARASGGGR